MLSQSALSKRLFLFLSSPWLHVFVLFSSPALILLGNRQWLFTGPGLIDPWIYVGFFLHYDYPSILVGEKKIDRLPWILPGFISYKLFGPIVANYILHWIYLVASPLTLYLILKRFFERWAAFGAAALMLFFTPLFGPAGWDWNGGGSGIFYLATFLAVSIAAQRDRSWTMLVVAAVLFAIMFHADVLLVNLTPLLILQYFCIRGEIDRRDIVTVAGTVIAAFIVVTVALGLINLSVGRQFWFSSILYDRITDLLAHPAKQVWWESWSSGWLLGLDGMPLCLVAVTFVAAVITLTRHGWRQALSGNPALSLQLQLVVAVTTFAAWQALGQTALQPWYMAVPIAYPTFLSLGALLHINSRQENLRSASYILLLTLPIFGALLLIETNVIAPGRIIWTPLEETFGVHRLAIPLFVFYLVAMAPILFKPTSMRIATLYLLMIGNFLNISSGQSSATPEAFAYGDGCSLRERLFAVIESASIALRQHSPNPDNLRLWWSDGKMLDGDNPRRACHLPVRYIAQPLASTGFPRLTSPWPTMPPIEKLTADIPQSPGSIIAVLGAQDDEIRTAETLSKLHSADGGLWRLTDQVKFDKQGLPISLYFFERTPGHATSE